MPSATPPDIKLWSPDLDWKEDADGTFRIWRKDPLAPYPRHMSERIFHWASVTPDQVWMAERGADGAWVKITYGQLAEQIQCVAQGLIDLGLTPDQPIVILSGNSLKHAVLALAAQHIGIPSAAISTAYSLATDDFDKLRSVIAQLAPAMVFVQQSGPFLKALTSSVPKDVIVASGADDVPSHKTVGWLDLVATTPTADVAREHAKTTPDTIAKFLFTSGTTGSPKAVIQTQRMLCSNQQMVLDCFAFMADEPPVVLDWAPWNHTASGNKVFYMALFNGGTYYIDAGKPTPALMAETIRNLHEISPTWYFNVPAGLEMLLEAMRDAPQLRDSFFRNLKMLMYAGAGLADHLWQEIKSLSIEATGHEILLTTGLGTTETGPFALYCTDAQDGPGNVGIPSQGIEMKLVPTSGKLEIRIKGPNVTPGYWQDDKTTTEAFDDEGYYGLGDALRFAVPGDPTFGFYFDGRIAENFKLATGTWVAVGNVRAVLNDALGGLARDVVVAGEGRNQLAAFLIPFRPAIERVVPDGASLSDAELLRHPALMAELAKRIAHYAKGLSGSSRRVARFMFLEQPLDGKRGELSEKGSVNQRAVLRNRAELIEVLYSDDPRVLTIS